MKRIIIEGYLFTCSNFNMDDNGQLSVTIECCETSDKSALIYFVNDTHTDTRLNYEIENGMMLYYSGENTSFIRRDKACDLKFQCTNKFIIPH